MSRVVVVIDSNTGAVIDVAGNKRETGRYAKFVKRMLSLDKNPTLDFGGNGGNTLTIARNGGVVAGTTINLVAETVKVSGTIKDKDGRTMEQIASDQLKYVLDRILGTTGEIDVYDVPNDSSSDSSDDSSSPKIQIALSESIVNRIKNLEERAGGEAETSYITKDALLEALDGISVEEDDDFETVKQQFAALLGRLQELAGAVGGSSSNSSSSSSSSVSGEGE